MAQKGINKDSIVRKAMEIIDQSGKPEISMRELAERLNIKTPSLYNHISSMEELLVCVSSRAAQQMKEVLLSAMEGKQGDEAVYALANAYRNFAKERKGLYKLIMASSALTNKDGHPSVEAMIIPVIDAISYYELTQEQVAHWQRVLRSIMHGFVAQEDAGFFRHYSEDINLSYSYAIKAFLLGLKSEKKRCTENG